MKYGVLFNKGNVNLGDDIQAYATARFYPSLDYFVDREHIHEFRSENNEPVAVIMNAWYMWKNGIGRRPGASYRTWSVSTMQITNSPCSRDHL